MIENSLMSVRIPGIVLGNKQIKLKAIQEEYEATNPNCFKTSRASK